MSRYVLERNWGQMDQDELARYAQRSVKLRQESFTDITWEHSHVVSGKDGTLKSFCIYQAPSEERVREHAGQVGGHLLEHVYEIGATVSPKDFGG